MLSPVTARRRAARRRKTSPSDTDIPGADSDLTATAAVYGPLLPAAGAVTGKARIRAAPAVRVASVVPVVRVALPPVRQVPLDP